MLTPDITVIVNLHSEGMLAHAAFLSVAHAKSQAEKRGLRVEVLAVLDTPTPETIEFVQTCEVLEFKTLYVMFRDLGRSRNLGVQQSRGRWIAFLDADDLWAENWLAAAFETAERDRSAVVWHPEVNLYFGVDAFIFYTIDMEDPDFDLLSLSMSNPWSASCFTSRELLAAVPYPETNFERQIAFEDWGWNLETVSKGCLHKCVPGTLYAVRIRPDSLVRQTSARRALPKHTDLFRKMILQKHLDSCRYRKPCPE